nr:hypothetical protein [Tanacetum cinerariifolium]
EVDFDLEEEIRLVENLLYDNSSPRPPKELNAEIADTIVESLSHFSIPIEDSDSLMDEIDLFLATDDLLPPRIKSDDYDSEGDIHFLEELLVNDSIPFPENKLFNFYHHDDLSFPRPPSEPSDVEFYFDFEPNSEEVIINELNEDECFDPGEGSKSYQKTASESAPAKEPMHTTLDEPSHQEFETGAGDDQPIVEAS